MSQLISKKLSAKALVGNVKTLAKPLKTGETLMLFRVVGFAKGVKYGETAMGMFCALMGDFVAIPLVGENEGKQYRTGQMFLPDVVNNLVIPTIENINKGDTVQMAFEVGITEDVNSAPGYVYTAKFLIEPDKNDPLEMLLNKAIPQLEAPKTTKAPAKADA